MLRTRVITAVILVVCFLLAVSLLSSLWWSLFILGAVLLAAHEWCGLWSFEPAQELIYLASIAGIAGLALFVLPPRILATPFYGCSVLFWFLAAPLWLKLGWNPASKLVGVFAGWLILVSFWLAMLDLRELGPWWLLAAMALVWVADIAA